MQSAGTEWYTITALELSAGIVILCLVLEVN